ncbi:MAG: hypothetical protein DYG98_21400 [Haliscomenobacteraceae bacterium CHB4]|nr:hypothetical protein [Haliscomenobacteraceae bacterium CHB4]
MTPPLAENKRAMNEIAKAFPSSKTIAVVADVSNEDAVRNDVAETMKAFNRIDGLCNTVIADEPIEVIGLSDDLFI